MLDTSGDTFTFVVTFRMTGAFVTVDVVLFSVTIPLVFRLVVSSPYDTCRDISHSNKIPTMRLLHDSTERGRNVISQRCTIILQVAEDGFAAFSLFLFYVNVFRTR